MKQFFFLLMCANFLQQPDVQFYFYAIDSSVQCSRQSLSTRLESKIDIFTGIDPSNKIETKMLKLSHISKIRFIRNLVILNCFMYKNIYKKNKLNSVFPAAQLFFWQLTIPNKKWLWNNRVPLWNVKSNGMSREIDRDKWTKCFGKAKQRI